MTKIAIIGAGLAGLTAAKGLRERADVHVFEKSWRAGGRMSTRSRSFAFDHGAQYFTARSNAFKAFLAPFIEAGVIARWNARFVELDRNFEISRRQWNSDFPHYTAVPAMNSLCLEMASGLDLRCETRVKRMLPEGSRWQLLDHQNQSLGVYDWIITAIPAEQTAALMPGRFAHTQEVAQKMMLPCYTLMLGFKQPPPIDFDAALVRNADISWISVNSSKPGRSSGFCLVVHSSNQWARRHAGSQDDNVRAHMLRELGAVIDQEVSNADYIDLHRWRYANIQKQSGSSALIDIENRLAAIGDWCIKGRVESAFTSGHDLALSLPL